MSEQLLEDFERFFDDLPDIVRDELSFMMVMLSDENIVVHDIESAYESAARSLFAARTRIGRIANLINAVSVFDVYFAVDTRERFDSGRNGPRSPSKKAGISLVLSRYSDRIGAMDQAGRRWQELRRTKLAP